MSAAAQELHSVVSETRSELAALDDRLQELVGAEWTGQAGSAFGGVWQRWHDGGEQMVRGLETMAALLERAAHSYHRTDVEGGASIASSAM